MNLLPYSYEEINLITRLTPVDALLRRHPLIDSHRYDVPNCAGHSSKGGVIYIDKDFDKRWTWLGKPVLATQFLILRELYTMTLIDALDRLGGRELNELTVRMRMVNRDDGPYEHSFSVGHGAIVYAVQQQYGMSGFRAYTRFMESQVKRPERLLNLPPDLRRMP